MLPRLRSSVWQWGGVDVPPLSHILHSSCKSMWPKPEGSLSSSRLGKNQQPPLCRILGNTTQVSSQRISHPRDRRSDRVQMEASPAPGSASRTERQCQSAELSKQVYSADSSSPKFQGPGSLAFLSRGLAVSRAKVTLHVYGEALLPPEEPEGRLGALRAPQHQPLGSRGWMHISDKSVTAPDIPPPGHGQARMKK